MIIHKKVSKLYIACFVFLIAGFLSSDCSRKLPTSPNTIKTADISATVKMPNKQLASILTSINLTVTTPGVATALLDTNLTLSGTKALAQIKLPAQKKLIFNARAYEGTNLVLQGLDSLTAKSGENINLPIKMKFTVPAIILTPTEKTVTAGDSISVYVNARSVTNLTTLGVQVTFDTTYLAVAGSNLEKTFMEKSGGTMKQLVLQEGSIPGTFNTIVSVFPATKAVSDSGKIARIIFRAKAVGTTDIAVSFDHTTNPDLGIYDNNVILVPFAIGLGNRVIIQ